MTRLKRLLGRLEVMFETLSVHSLLVYALEWATMVLSTLLDGASDPHLWLEEEALYFMCLSNFLWDSSSEEFIMREAFAMSQNSFRRAS
jgi:hypothetical protein